MADITITESDTLGIDYVVENTGGESEVQDIRLLIDGAEVDSRTDVSVIPGTTVSGTFEWPTATGDAGVYTAEIVSDNDTVTASVEVVEPSVDVATGAVTDIESDRATVGGDLVALVGVDEVEVAVEYRETGASSWSVEPAGTLSTATTFDATVTGLAGETEYEARARGDAVSYPASDVGAATTFTTASAIPDSGMFQDPIYQWWAGDGIGVSDGSEASSWVDALSDVTATAVDSPTFRENHNGEPAVEYDGSNDGHDFSPDSQMPSGNEAVSAVVLFWIAGTDTSDRGNLLGWGNSTGGHAGVNNDSFFFGNLGSTNLEGGSVSEGFHTIGFRSPANSLDIDLIGDGSQVDAGSLDTGGFDDADHGIGYRRRSDDFFFDGYVVEVIISAAEETDQAFSDYHDDRLGS